MSDPARPGGKGRKRATDADPAQPAADHAVSAETPLSDREQLFVSAFVGVARRNGVEAARLAGYKPTKNNLKYQSQMLRKRANVQAAIAEALEARKLALGLDSDMLLEEMAAIAYGNVKNIISVTAGGDVLFNDPESIAPEHWAAVKSIQIASEETTIESERQSKTTVKRTVSITMHDKRQALANLMESFGVLKRPDADKAPPHVFIDLGGITPYTEAEKAAIRADRDKEAAAQADAWE